KLLTRALEAAARRHGSAHDGTRDQVLALVGAARGGHSGVPQALRDVEAAFVVGVSDRCTSGEARAEFRRMVQGAADRVVDEPVLGSCSCAGDLASREGWIP